jgi:trans-aconitate 2-methyltransferase
MKYTFGTSRIAAKRLREISRFFNPLAVNLIKTYVREPVPLVLDLGCGPGFTTHMLSDAVAADRIIGTDNSPDFLRRARRRFPSFQFIEFDITRIPFPVRPNVIYARFVLSHLASPVGLVNRWVRELARGGFAFIEEVERIDTEVESFSQYLEVNDEIVKSGGANLFVGKELGEGVYEGNVLLNESVSLPVLDYDAATWFLPNVATIWKKDPCVSRFLSKREIRAVSKEFKQLIRSRKQNSRITWHMRRIVIRASRQETTSH